jgi:hypothetical protein
MIEHYPLAVPTTNTFFEGNESLELRKDANYNSAMANLLFLKQMYLQSKHKMWDIEGTYNQLKDEGASQVRLDTQMMAVREALTSMNDLAKEVSSMEAEIAKKYGVGV